MSKIKTGHGWPHDVTKKDLEITYFNGTGCGGQNRNKNANCVRIKHKPTGTIAQAQEHKSRAQNMKAAFRRLGNILIPIMKNEVSKERYSAGTERIRTYDEKAGLVIDSRLTKKFEYKDVLDGKGLTILIEELIKSQVD